jgi:hypothetical protein
MTRGLFVTCPSIDINAIAEAPPRNPRTACLKRADGAAEDTFAICLFMFSLAVEAGGHAGPAMPASVS